MQTFKIEVKDSIADKIVWFLNSLEDVKIQKIDTITQEDTTLINAIQDSIEEVKNAKSKSIPLKNAWDLIDEL